MPIPDPKPKNAPWPDSQEFVRVFELLFSSTDPIATRDIALQYILDWRAESPSDMPPAIRATCALLTALIPVDTSTRPHVIYHRRLALSMAIIQTVNFLIDPVRDETHIKSDSLLAIKLKLPLAFLELRQRCMYDTLPNLSVLEDSAKRALNWLYSNYWLPTARELQEPNQVSYEAIACLHELLTNYKRSRKQYILAITSGEYVPIEQHIVGWINSTTRALEPDANQRRDSDYHHKCRAQCIDALCSAMCQSGVLVPRTVYKRTQTLNGPLPPAVAQVYLPLIQNLCNEYPDLFFRSLIFTLLQTINVDLVPDNSPKSSMYFTCAAWLDDLLKTAPEAISVGPDAVKFMLLHFGTYARSTLEMLSRANRPLWLTDEDIKSLIDARTTNPSSSQIATTSEVDQPLQNIQSQWNGHQHEIDQTQQDNSSERAKVDEQI